MNKRAARAGADLTLVQCEHDETFDRLVEEIVILGAHIAEEDVGRLATQFERHRDQVLRGVLHDQSAGCRLAGEGDLGNAARRGEWLARFEAEAVHERSAILFRIWARSVELVRPQTSLAAWAASSAARISDSSERATSHTGWPVIGETLSKYLPTVGARQSPPMKFSYRLAKGGLS